ncbi:probable inactive poly [ADP-ribose] polymerase sro5 [Phtheirospermum japonicum]|uniref:Probable inactive poly [ADP-ribose] polymerase sro5 n=1 Tax=Phtheirospermum japonicum TaxID=374723 RepID=A0A830CXZ3_9LAMI|nr:probable inactive poly [ADP-ribose] polymerase sro5 [Phtheirospermum japonicum]
MMCGGDANVKRGWYGASKGEVNGVLVSGFDYPRNHGVYLSAKDHPVESLQSSPSDEDGVMHMLICRVILGRLEERRLSTAKFTERLGDRLLTVLLKSYAQNLGFHGHIEETAGRQTHKLLV